MAKTIKIIGNEEHDEEKQIEITETIETKKTITAKTLLDEIGVLKQQISDMENRYNELIDELAEIKSSTGLNISVPKKIAKKVI